MKFIENKTFDEINIGDAAELKRSVKAEDINLFAVASGDVNPLHVDQGFAEAARFHHVIAHGMWGGALISTLLGTELPGPGAIYVKQTLRFLHPIGIGDEVTVRIQVTDKNAKNHHIILNCTCRNQDEDMLISGEAEIVAPDEKIKRPRAELSEIHLHKRGERFAKIFDVARRFKPLSTAVVHPCDAITLQGAVAAFKEGFIAPYLVGPRKKIETVAANAAIDISNIDIIDAPHSHAAAAIAVSLIREKKAQALMKGALHTDEVMQAVLDREMGLRTERRMSHVFVFDLPHYEKLLLISDAAINIDPDLEVKKDITQNAIDCAQALGVEDPKVAILSAVETVSSKLRSTTDAASLCKMADRGQITGGVLDGPLAFDNAVSKKAAQTKHIDSAVAGAADILIAPDLESGNMIAKQLVYMAGGEAAGVVLGASAPIMLTSRADDELSRLASAAVANLIFNHTRKATS